MFFDPSKYNEPTIKKLPVILLLDVSGSMEGEKIDTLYKCVIEMTDAFAKAPMKDAIIDIAIITFGNDKAEIHTEYTSVSELMEKKPEKFTAEGSTPLGKALTITKEMIEDKNRTPSRIYRPAVVLVSDGKPNDEWQEPMERFINEGRSQKCQRFAIAIGNTHDAANIAMLNTFAENESQVLRAEEVSGISDCFRKVTMSVSQRATSVNPNKMPSAKNLSVPKNNDADDDDEVFL